MKPDFLASDIASQTNELDKPKRIKPYSNRHLVRYVHPPRFFGMALKVLKHGTVKVASISSAHFPYC